MSKRLAWKLLPLAVLVVAIWTGAWWLTGVLGLSYWAVLVWVFWPRKRS